MAGVFNRGKKGRKNAILYVTDLDHEGHVVRIFFYFFLSIFL